jgi:hypothetical protein
MAYYAQNTGDCYYLWDLSEKSSQKIGWEAFGCYRDEPQALPEASEDLKKRRRGDCRIFQAQTQSRLTSICCGHHFLDIQAPFR